LAPRCLIRRGLLYVALGFFVIKVGGESGNIDSIFEIGDITLDLKIVNINYQKMSTIQLILGVITLLIGIGLSGLALYASASGWLGWLEESEESKQGGPIKDADPLELREFINANDMETRLEGTSAISRTGGDLSRFNEQNPVRQESNSKPASPPRYPPVRVVFDSRRSRISRRLFHLIHLLLSLSLIMVAVISLDHWWDFIPLIFLGWLSSAWVVIDAHWLREGRPPNLTLLKYYLIPRRLKHRSFVYQVIAAYPLVSPGMDILITPNRNPRQKEDNERKLYAVMTITRIFWMIAVVLFIFGVSAEEFGFEHWVEEPKQRVMDANPEYDDSAGGRDDYMISGASRGAMEVVEDENTMSPTAPLLPHA
jgi:hypothetical protein